MRNFIKKYKVNLTIAVFAIAVLSFAYLAIIPLISKIATKADGIQQQKIDKELNEKKLASIAHMESDFGKFKNNTDKLNITIDQTKELDFIKELESLAEQTNNKIEFNVDDSANSASAIKSKAGDTSIKSKLKYTQFLSMKIALEGSYASLLNFVNKLENYKNYTNIITISSEKKTIEGLAPNHNPFVAANQAPQKKLVSETVNSILDVVVYLKK
jgi:hypothetical protein